MKPVFQLFWQMCLLRQSPAYVPTHPWFVAAVVGANILCSLLLSLMADPETTGLEASTRIIVGQATTAGLVWLALYLREFADRFPATITALLGCDLLITACFAALIPVTASLYSGVANLVYLGFIVWSLAVAGFILHRALNVSLNIAVLASIAIMLLSIATGEIASGRA